jgi:glutamyl-tRNA reductase
VPSAAREAFAAELDGLDAEAGTIVVHTCHRVELYAVRGEGAERPLPEPPPGTRRLRGPAAARHLIVVACGLDSTVLGENQVLHQLREVIKRRHAADIPLDPALDRLFQMSLHAGRRARSWLSGRRQSLADVALECVERQVGPLEGRPLLVVGGGAMGRLAAVAAARRETEVIVTSRTAARAEALAGEVGGRTVPFRPAGDLPEVAGALVAVCGPWQLGEAPARRLAASGAVVVDMSSPTAIAEELQQRLGDRFVSTDDLAGERSFEPQGQLRQRLEELVDEAGDAYRRWLRTRGSVPAIQAIGEAADEQRSRELKWLFNRLPELDERDRALIEQMSHRLVAGLLHAPRSALNADNSGELARAARDLFGT